MNRLRDIRKSKHLSIYELASICGLSKNTIANIEKGIDSNIKIETLNTICGILEITYKDLFPDNKYMR